MNTLYKIIHYLLNLCASMWIYFIIYYVTALVLKDNKSELVSWVMWIGGTALWYNLIVLIPETFNSKFKELEVNIHKKFQEERLETIKYIQSWIK